MTKSILFIFLPMYLILGCQDQKLTHQETVTKYYQARDASEFEDLMTYVSDSLTIIEGDYVMPYSRNSLYEVFKWDSVFRSSYQLVDLEEVVDGLLASVAITSDRNVFLRNSTMTCQYKISFLSGKISKIESLECLDADWNIWQGKRDSLVNWIDLHHPRLNGFINDMTMNGAINYLKAIELYNIEHNATIGVNNH